MDVVEEVDVVDDVDDVGGSMKPKNRQRLFGQCGVGFDFAGCVKLRISIPFYFKSLNNQGQVLVILNENDVRKMRTKAV
jgi:hypothetical protein